MEGPSLESCGLTLANFSMLIEESSISSSMKGNPFLLTEVGMTGILMKVM